MTFDVTKEFEVMDLTDVKEEKNLFPVTKGLKVRIDKAGPQANKAKNIFALKLELRAVDGIPGADGAMSRINAPLFTSIMDLVYGADMTVDGRSESKWWKGNQHLVEFKNFCAALDIPLSGIKVNDEFFANLLGREVLVDVVHEAETTKDSDGKRQKTGAFNQKLKNWKKAA